MSHDLSQNTSFLHLDSFSVLFISLDIRATYCSAQFLLPLHHSPSATVVQCMWHSAANPKVTGSNRGRGGSISMKAQYLGPYTVRCQCTLTIPRWSKYSEPFTTASPNRVGVLKRNIQEIDRSRRFSPHATHYVRPLNLGSFWDRINSSLSQKRYLFVSLPRL